MSKDLTGKFETAAEPTKETLLFIAGQPGLVEAMLRQGAASYPSALSAAAAAAKAPKA